MRRPDRARHPDFDPERGAALLTVLMLVAVIAVMAGMALEKLRLSTRLAGNAAAAEQARAYAFAAETLATAKIGDLLAQSPTRVSLLGGWSGRPFPLPFPGGVAVARVSDGGNCFNLNGLVTEPAPGTYIANPIARAQFARLMRIVEVPAQVAEQVASGASDWIDSDQEPQSQGAEDGAYLGQATPYRTAGTLMTDPSELRAVAGVTPDIYARLRPWICTLPVAAPSLVNVNTLSPEQAPLLGMLLPDSVGIGSVRQALLARPPQGYGQTTAFWQSRGLAGTFQGNAPSFTAVTSKWFALDIAVTIGTTALEEHAVVDASRLPAQLVSRQWGERS